METITRINGNKQPYTVEMPKIIILTDEINDTALKHIEENTGLKFTNKTTRNYEAQPTTGLQIAALFLTYNFKTRYYNNWEAKNTLFLKFDHHVGFQVDSICKSCADYNGIHSTIKQGERLAS